MLLPTILACLVLLLITQHLESFFNSGMITQETANDCRDVDLQLQMRPKQNRFTSSFRLVGQFNINLDVQLMRLEFEPYLKIGEDYWIEAINKFKLPAHFHGHPNEDTNSFRVFLNMNSSFLYKPNSYMKLSLINVKYCGQSRLPQRKMAPQLILYNTGRSSTRSSCPASLLLPRVSPSFQLFVSASIAECRETLIVPITRLSKHSVSSLNLLYLNPPLLMIDARKNSLETSVYIIDAYLAAHSVLDIVWEPIYSHDPLWWLLMPKPHGVPGHLSAMIDQLQFRHPSVIDGKQRFKNNINCTKYTAGCIPGCPDTKVVVTWAAGWGADTNRWASELTRALVDADPMQIGPVRMSFRKSFPAWNDRIGWQYTFFSCESNFLDCAFLDHSPCPHIAADVWNDPGVISMNKTRFNSLKSWNDNYSPRPSWWSSLTGTPSENMPEESILDLNDVHSQHTMYSFFVRPKYSMRKALEIATKDFALEQDSCVFMHIRRGDVLLHGEQSRAYVPLHVYVKAAKPYLDVFGLRTILLLTDSAVAIEEAHNCTRDYPDICTNLVFRYIQKRRWVGAEGGWENPFPSGQHSEELLVVLQEFSLVQKCAFGVLGDSAYGHRALAHVACKFPLANQGIFPQRCLQMPYIKVDQSGFDCKGGYELLCKDINLGGDQNKYIDDPDNMGAANFSKTEKAFRKKTRIEYFLPDSTDRHLYFSTSELDFPAAQAKIRLNSKRTLKYLCSLIKDRVIPKYCKNNF